MVQAILVSFLCLIFILMPTVNSTYWVLSVLTAQLALLVYIALFASALKLHYHRPEVARSFRVPGRKWGMGMVCTLGTLSCFTVILFGFMPPEQVPFKSVGLYELMLVSAMAVCCLIPLYFVRKRAKAKHKL